MTFQPVNSRNNPLYLTPNDFDVATEMIVNEERDDYDSGTESCLFALNECANDIGKLKEKAIVHFWSNESEFTSI